MDRLANLGYGISVGHESMCGQVAADRTIHIRKAGERPCQVVRPGDLSVEMIERITLGRNEINRVYDFAKGDGSLFVHCGVGMCRSPTVSVIALVARGCKIGTAMGLVTQGTCEYRQEPIMPHWEFDVMEEIRRVLAGR